MINKIFKEFIIRFAPSSFSLKQTFLKEKYFKSIKVKGQNVSLLRNIVLKRRNGLILGSDVVIEGGGKIDATAGILVGDSSILKKGINLITSQNGADQYDPIIIGAGNIVDKDLSPGEILPNKLDINGLSAFNGQLVFIVSTGRSGSKTIAHLLNQHPDAECYHDAFPHIYTWSCNLIYARKQEKEIYNKLDTLFNAISFNKNKVIGQSDQKLAPLIPLLAKMFPKAKFLWLIRKADSFISSSYPRGWFRNSEFGYEQNLNEFFDQEVKPSPFDAAHRTNGFKAAEMNEKDWKSMTAFERNCWYWTYWNNLIEKSLFNLSSTRYLKVELEKLSLEKEKILKFLGLENFNVNAKKNNAAKYKKISKQDWSPKMLELYNKHCEVGMKKWFSSN